MQELAGASKTQREREMGSLAFQRPPHSSWPDSLCPRRPHMDKVHDPTPQPTEGSPSLRPHLPAPQVHGGRPAYLIGATEPALSSGRQPANNVLSVQTARVGRFLFLSTSGFLLSGEHAPCLQSLSKNTHMWCPPKGRMRPISTQKGALPGPLEPDARLPQRPGAGGGWRRRPQEASQEPF